MESAFGNLNIDNAENVSNAIAKLVSEAAPGHAGLKAHVESGKALPEEPMDMVKAEASVIVAPMSLEETKEHRLKLMDERSRF
jgi:hypothetical protein